MSRLILLLFLTTISYSDAICQEKSKDKISLNELVIKFVQAIENKDSTGFREIFLNEKVPFVGIMSKATEMSIKKDYPDFEGVSISNCEKFIKGICKTDKKQIENIYDLKIDTDGAIGAISFDYSYFSSTNMIQWGNEKWNLVKIGNEWLITDVIYSIHFPDVEIFPYKE